MQNVARQRTTRNLYATSSPHKRGDGVKYELGAWGRDTATVAPIPAKPEGIRRQRYERIVSKLEEADKKLWRAEWEWIRRLKSRGVEIRQKLSRAVHSN